MARRARMRRACSNAIDWSGLDMRASCRQPRAIEPGLSALELWHLLELARLQHAPGAVVQLSVGQSAFAGANGLDEPERQRTVVAAVDEGVRRGLRVLASRDQDFGQVRVDDVRRLARGAGGPTELSGDALWQ